MSRLLAGLTRDAISDAMKALPTPREQPEYLSPTQLQQLLEAAVRYDEAVFAAFPIRTECRRGEALGLTWADVDLDALDSQGRTVADPIARGEHEDAPSSHDRP